jgi:hypothetical protein
VGAADEGDEAGTPGRCGDRAHDGVVGVGAAVAEPHPAIAVAGDQRQKLLGQRHRLIVGRADAARRRQARHHTGDRLRDRGVVVAERCRPPGARQIENSLPALVDQIRAFAADHRQREEADLLDLGNDPAFAVLERLSHGPHSLIVLRAGYGRQRARRASQ